MTTIAAPRARTQRQSHIVADSITMLRRTMLHMVRYPALSLFTILGPVVALLLFVFVFGGTLGAGLPGIASGGDPADARAAYLAYVMPGILAITIAGTAGGTAITVSMDMTEGITARFRTMAIARSSVLAGHVIGNTLQALIAVALVLVVGVLVGFRPTASLLDWLALLGIVTLIAFAITWIGVGMGMQAKSVESASNLPLLVTLLPLLGSGFVPTDSMPVGLAWFAEYQPFTPFIESIRGLLLGTPLEQHLLLAIAWSVGLAVIGTVWSLALYERKSVR